MSTVNRATILRELQRKDRIFAFTGRFLTDLQALAAAEPDLITVEVFPAPRDRRGFATPPIGVATLRRPS